MALYILIHITQSHNTHIAQCHCSTEDLICISSFIHVFNQEKPNKHRTPLLQISLIISYTHSALSPNKMCKTRPLTTIKWAKQINFLFLGGHSSV